MSQKELITQKEIEYDIISNLKTPKEMSKSHYKKWAFPCAAIGIAFAVCEFLNPNLLFIWGFALLLIVVVIIATETLARRYKTKNVCIDDYEVVIDTLSHIEEESYEQTGGGKSHRHSRFVNNYILHFDSGKSYRIPKDNYTWSKERPMSDFAIYQSSHRGDKFILAIKKDSGEAVTAYHTDFFEYKK